jgi:hypothetical protein
MDVDCQQASAGETAPLRPTLRARGCASAASSLSSSRHHALPTAVELLISLVDGGSATSMAGSARRWQENETTQAAGGCGATHESARACWLLPLASARAWCSPFLAVAAAVPLLLPLSLLCCYHARRDPWRHGTPPRRRRVHQPPSPTIPTSPLLPGGRHPMPSTNWR